MNSSGFHHVGLATHNMEATLAFYEDVLGFKTKVCDVINPEAGGAIRHAFLDTGHGEMIAFMEFNDVKGIDADFDAGINRGLGLGGGVMHFAFKANDEADLQARKDHLQEHGVKARGIVDHGWCKSVYFVDPNGIQLEYCVVTENLDESHLKDQSSIGWTKHARV